MFGLPGTSWVPTNSTNCLCEIALILMFGLASIATSTCGQSKTNVYYMTKIKNFQL